MQRAQLIASKNNALMANNYCARWFNYNHHHEGIIGISFGVLDGARARYNRIRDAAHTSVKFCLFLSAGRKQEEEEKVDILFFFFLCVRVGGPTSESAVS